LSLVLSFVGIDWDKLGKDGSKGVEGIWFGGGGEIRGVLRYGFALDSWLIRYITLYLQYKTLLK
jgi:hypothetical protein